MIYKVFPILLDVVISKEIKIKLASYTARTEWKMKVEAYLMYPQLVNCYGSRPQGKLPYEWRANVNTMTDLTSQCTEFQYGGLFRYDAV